MIEAGMFIYCHEDGCDGKSPLSGISEGQQFDIAYLKHCKSFHLMEGIRSFAGQPMSKRHPSIEDGEEYKKFVQKEENDAAKQYAELELDFEKSLIKILDRDSLSKLNQLRGSRLFDKYYRKAWELGRKSSGTFYDTPIPITAKETKWFNNLVSTEAAFWQKFMSDSYNEKKTKFDPALRLEMYVKNMQAVFNAGRLSGLPKNVLLFWYPEKKLGRMCPGCTYMVNHSPFTQRTMPTVPRGGDTPCLMRCVHKVIVRVVSEDVMLKRESELPGKDSMIADLKRFMKYRPIRLSKEANPWNGKARKRLK
jgi:hypothetical protein